MANIATTDIWSPDVYQWADGDVLNGGPESLEVLPVKQMANRSLYQRLRSVTPWSDVLAAAYGYPQGACVMHSNVSWRAKIANAVEPGTDATKWERWGFSDDEFNAKLATFLPYAAPTACSNTGPDGVADKAKIHKSALGEYWMWLGDAWQVVAGHFGERAAVAVAFSAAGVYETVKTFTAARAGIVSLGFAAACITESGTANYIHARALHNGTNVVATDAYGYSGTGSGGQTMQAAGSSARWVVAAGDVISVQYRLGGAITASGTPSIEWSIQYIG